MGWGKDLLDSAYNSNAGQTLVNAGAQRAADEIWGRDGFGGEEVNSPTAPVAAPTPAPMEAAPTPAKKKISKKMIWGGVGVVIVGGFWLLRGGKKKGGKK